MSVQLIGLKASKVLVCSSNVLVVIDVEIRSILISISVGKMTNRVESDIFGPCVETAS
jgi:hypothetical protein